jgi:hypothetical protein
MAAVARRYPREFRDDVVRVARRHEAPRAQITRDFGISDATLYEWLRRADVNNLQPSIGGSVNRNLGVPNRVRHMSEDIGQGTMRWTFRRRLLASLILLPIGFGLWIAFGLDHSIANGGQIYEEVSAIGNAVPKSATDIHIESSAASWIGGCSAVPGSKSGWTTDQISVNFDDSETRNLVVSAIARSLKFLGWQRHDSAPGLHRGKIPHWTLDVKSAHFAQAWAFPVGPGTRHWYLSGSWRPPGPVGQGCP